MRLVRRNRILQATLVYKSAFNTRRTYVSEGGSVLDVRAAGNEVAGVGVGLLGLDLLLLDHVHGRLAVGQHRVHRRLHLGTSRRSMVMRKAYISTGQI